MSLKIKMFGRGFGYSPFSVTNWNVSPYDNQLGGQVYDVIESGKLADLRFSIFGDDTVRVEYYENNAVIPTRVRELIIAR
jgi:hypothetical protein